MNPAIAVFPAADCSAGTVEKLGGGAHGEPLAGAPGSEVVSSHVDIGTRKGLTGQ